MSIFKPYLWRLSVCRVSACQHVAEYLNKKLLDISACRAPAAGLYGLGIAGFSVLG